MAVVVDGGVHHHAQAGGVVAGDLRPQLRWRHHGQTVIVCIGVGALDEHCLTERHTIGKQFHPINPQMICLQRFAILEHFQIRVLAIEVDFVRKDRNLGA